MSDELCDHEAAPRPPGFLAGLEIRRATSVLAGTRRQHGRGLAIVIGINSYGADLKLDRARADAEAVGDVLHRAHGYDTVACLDHEATGAQLRAIAHDLPAVAKGYRRLVVFFAGHGRAETTEDGLLVGSLLPCDAQRSDPDTLFPMSALRDAVATLKDTVCRHVLVILDCCSAGAFARTREAAARRPQLAHARYEWVTRHAAAQVLVSAAHDEAAFDSISQRKASDQQNSPFTSALLRALSTRDADRKQDGVVLATDLYHFIQDELWLAQQDRRGGARQTPMIFTLPWHAGGDFGFLLVDDPRWRDLVALDSKSIPYAGLRPLHEDDKDVFYGRETLVDQLGKLAAEPGRPFLVLTGASGVGKSSLLAAGLVPHLKQEHGDWTFTRVLRLGADPLGVVRAALRAQFPEWDGERSPVATVRAWAAQASGRTLVLVFDQLEELVTRPTASARAACAQLVGELVRTGVVRVLGAVRAGLDTETVALLAGAAAAPETKPDPSAFVVHAIRPMNREELREVIERPAEERVIFFDETRRDQRTLVDSLLDAVEALPGSLPLLSLTLNALCLHYLQSGRADRKLLWGDLEHIVGVAGAITRVAEGVYMHTIDAQGKAVPAPTDADELAAHQAIVRRVMLRMVDGGPHGWTRRLVSSKELYGEATPEAQDRTGKRTRDVVQTLVTMRLVVESKDGYEPGHDLLIEGWPRLRAWLATDGERVLATRRLTAAAVDWHSGSRRRNLLWGDRRLALVAQLRRRPVVDPAPARDRGPSLARRIFEYVVPARLVAGLEPDWLNGVERAFVLASAGRRRTTSLGFASIPVVVGGIVAVLIAAFNAREQRSAVAEVNELAAAVRLVRDNPEEIVNAAPRALAAYADRQQHYERHPPGALGLLSEIAEHRNSLPIGSVSAPGSITDLRVDDRGMTAILDRDHRMALWRLDRDGKTEEIALQSAPSSACNGRFSPDGRRVACVITDAIQTWDTATGASVPPIAAPSAIGAPVFSARGTWVAALLSDSGQYVWNPIEGQPTEDRPPPLPQEDNGQTQVVTLSPDGRWMATARADHRVQLWSAGAAPVRELGEHRDVVTSAAFDPRGERVVSGGMDFVCRLWEVVVRAADRALGPSVLVGSRSAIEVVHFTSNGHGVVAHANGSSRPVDLWSTEPTGIRLDLPHSGAVTTAIYSPDGGRILTGSLDQMVRVWDARSGRLREHRPYPTRSSAVAFGPDGTWFVEALYSGESPIARVWTEAKNTSIELTGHRQPIVAIKVSHDGKQIATASEDGTVRIWDPGGKCLGVLEHSPMTTGERQLHLEGVLDVDWSHDDQLLVTAGADGQAKIWDAKGRTLIARLIGHTGAVTSASFSANGVYVLTSGRDGSARLWQAPWKTPIAKLVGHAGAVTRSRLSPTSEFAVTASDDGMIRIWSVPSGDLVHVLEGHTRAVLDIAISPSGEQIASGGEDWTVRLWDRRRGTLDAVFEDHSGPVVSVGYRSDGRRVVSAGKDGYARVFPTSAEEPLDRLCEVLVKAPDAASGARSLREAADRFCAARHLEQPEDFVAVWHRLYP